MQRRDYFKRVREIRPNGFTYTSKGNKERRREKQGGQGRSPQGALAG